MREKMRIMYDGKDIEKSTRSSRQTQTHSISHMRCSPDTEETAE
jgi:hypothetical protein